MDLLGDETRLARRALARIRDGVFEVSEETDVLAIVVVIDENGALPQDAAAMLEDDVDDGVEQWMAGAEQLGMMSIRHIDLMFLEADAFIALQDMFEMVGCALAAHLERRALDLVAALLARHRAPAEGFECRKEEALDEVWLELACLHALHVGTDGCDVGRAHDVACQGVLS